MTEFRITCVTKPDRFSSHERITSVGVEYFEKRLTVAEVVHYIQSKALAFYTLVNGRKAPVGVVDVPGRASYIRTHADGTWNDNLLALPECVS
jgi:hypothetical protein